MSHFMQKVKYLALVVVLISALKPSYAQTEKPAPQKELQSLAEFTNADYNMGTILTGKNTEFTVSIKNISKSDTLEIETIKVSCGCTTPKYRNQELILPGQTAMVTLGFNGSARGEFTKFADIVFKGGYSKQIKFYGNAIVE